MHWPLKRRGTTLETAIETADERSGPDSLGRSTIELVVGLGNPGAAFAGNRHNAGFRAVNALSKRLAIDVGKHSRIASVGEGFFGGRRLVLAKPRTYMNDSGRAVGELIRRYHLQPEQLLLIYDELDLPLGRVRVRPGGGSGGQKGMRSIVEAVGSPTFPRIRIGIGRPIVGDAPSWQPDVIAAWVLSDPPPGDRRLLDEAVARAADAALCCLEQGVEAAMRAFNGAG